MYKDSLIIGILAAAVLIIQIITLVVFDCAAFSEEAYKGECMIINPSKEY